MIDWDKLRIFHAVAEAGSFTHAGNMLNSSQSAVSRQISSIEETINIILFHRHARGLILTEEGELLHRTTKEIFDQLSMIEGKLMDTKQLPEGPLRITVAEFIGTTWLAPKLSRLRKDHPGLQLTLLIDDKILNLGMREADAAIRLHKPEQPDLIQRHLTSIEFRICACKSYLEEHGRPLTPKDLRNTLLGYPDTVPPPFADPNWLFRIAGVNPHNHNNLILMNSMYGIERAVSKGAGIATLPDYLVKSNPDLEELLPDIQRHSVDMYFVYPEERRNSKRISLFRDFLLENLDKKAL